ncbi:D-alanyl-D-alanine carboxypeptidase family protein [Arthrobacter sp. E3]|uniref:D-alanyl-D-alanine carboxypeptidase family protein n=1 Tax=Arthrobacter sp. E3 TaxID=517402 RepID=UPI001A94C97E|nr:D-alanyl-D-alanine carboxypeptidase family protein [Arthrobacter sp. E3]
MKSVRFLQWALAGVAALSLSMGGTVAATAATPDQGVVAAKYASVGGAGGFLGQPVTPLRCGLPAGGCYRQYRGGSVYWSSASGAHVSLGGIRARWASFGWERGFLGYPLTDENCTLVNRGCVQKFQGGLIYWQSSVGAHAVHGGILSKYAQMGYENSPLGYPRSDEACTGTTSKTCTQLYLGGSIVWRTGQGTSVTPTSGSIGYVVNKRRPNAPINRTPADLVVVGSQYMRREAANQLQAMFRAAAGGGVGITTVSGFRSYSTQLALYNQYVAQYGRAYADTISARAGYSEHQTGLVMDIGNPNGACGLSACFATTPAGAFAANHAWRYGFIVRYTNGYTAITGYAYEPWHLRYVGVRVSTAMHNLGYQTLEQYFGLPAAPDY